MMKCRKNEPKVRIDGGCYNARSARFAPLAVAVEVRERYYSNTNRTLKGEISQTIGKISRR